MVTKICVGDYVQDIYHCAKLHYDPIRGFCPIYAKLPTECSLGYFLGSELTSRYPNAVAPILTLSTSKDVVSRRDVPFGVPRRKVYILTLFSPKTEFWVDFRWDRNFFVSFTV